MKDVLSFLSVSCLICCLLSCEKRSPSGGEVSTMGTEIVETSSYGSFNNQIEWGEHLVFIADCNECHTPKKITDKGPELDMSLMLSGHPTDMPGIDVDRKDLEKKGIAASAGSTEWVGPWGISYAGNLTPHETGIGNWTEEQFFLALRKGKYKGLEGSRNLLPPMPWTSYRHMTDDEIKAMFAYLKSIKPVNNIVPAAVPPIGE